MGKVPEPAQDRALVLGHPAEDHGILQGLLGEPLQDDRGVRGGKDLDPALAGGGLQGLHQKTNPGGMKPGADLLDDPREVSRGP